MCYGNLDPKFALRETEARLKGVSFQSTTQNTPAPEAALGPLVWVRAAVAWLKRKDAAHV